MRLLVVPVLALTLAAAAQQRDAPRPTLVEVLAVADATAFDGPSFEALVRTGEAAIAPLLAAYRTSIDDEERGARRRDRVLRALRAMGPRAAEAGPDLIELLGGAERDQAPDLLATLAATVGLAPEPERLHADAERAWSRFITPGDPGFIHRLQGAIRLHMRMTHPLPTDDLESLVAALDDDDPYVRELAAELLGRLGTRGRAALDALEHTANDDDQPRHAALPNHSLGSNFAAMIHTAANVAIARIAPDDPRAVPGLRALLGADHPRERIEAAMALGRQASESAVGDLVKALADDDLRVVAEAVTALGMVETSAPTAVAAVRALADHADPSIAARARATLRRMGITVPARR